VLDADGIASALVRNTVTSQSWPVTVAADGSFGATAVVGSIGDTIALEATDAHPVQALTTVTTIGGLPANSGAPVIDAAGIQVHWAAQDLVAAGYELVAGAGAISDNEPPIALAVTDQRSGSKWQASLTSGAALTYRLLGGDVKAGDLLELRATDSHPTAAASASITLGPLPEEAQTQVDTSKIRLLAMGHGYQAGGTPGAVTDPAPPITVVLKNRRTEWQSSVLNVRSDGGFYARVEGQEGDEFTLVATVQKDGAPVSTAPVSLGQLPATGVYANGDLLTGHTISVLRDRLAVLDGGTQVVWMADLPPPADHFYPGVTAARDVFFNYRLQMPMALAGGDVVGWFSQGTPPTLQPITLAVSPGVLTRAKVRGDELYAVAEESTGLVLYRLTLPVISNGALTVDCGDTIRATPIPGTGGLHALEILPAGDGRIAVLTDDPTAELRVLDASDPVTTTVVGSLDLAGASLPKWGAWQTGELFVGRADGSLELWRWADAGMQRVTSWHPAQAEARAAIRMGDELFVGTSVGVVQQVDIWDASQPRLLGEDVFGSAIVGMSQELDRMLVATAQDLNAVTVPKLALTLAPDSVSWSYGGGRMVAAATFGGFWAGSASFAWSDGTKGIANDCPFCEVAIDGDVHDPPTVTTFTGDGVQSAPYTPSAVRLRSFDAGTGPELVRVPHTGPLTSCDATRAATWDAAVSVGGPHGGWLVYGFAGQVDAGYRFTDPNTQEVTTRTLATSGPLLDVSNAGLYLVTVANDLTLWDIDVNRGADPYNPVKRQQLAVQIGTPEVVKLAPDGSILLAANAPARYAAVVPDPQGNGSNAFEVIGDNIALSGLEGKIRDLYQGPNILYVLTDAGVAGRVYAYSNGASDQPTLLAQIDLSAGAPGVGLGIYAGDDSNTVAEALTVVRQGWGVETYSLDLSAKLGSLRLPGDARAVHWNWGNYVLLGNVGVARLLGPPSQLTPQYLLSNLFPPGNVTHAWTYGLVASEGVPWP